ncbi:uncharacterized protein PAC_18977 [Phialocephala subalpina]|uniref:Heterokaryon incompatibility domain-containing protein n=1 Tax=Phialocephala subalpina TaxID=576137 RepID=A0A1L7XVL4_9HELO|nr:uncharacterized protein PAC_18977 [Phialocephala subalpina]
MATKSEHTAIGSYLEEGQVSPNLTAINSPSKSKLHQHKDGLHRYADAKPEHRNKDHFLQADDGKLEVLRVQLAPNNRTSQNLKTTWERPKVENQFKVLWRGFRDAPRDIVTWAYNDSLKSDTPQPDIYFKYPVACLVLTLTALIGNIEADLLWGGRYPPVRYSYFCYPKVARNEREGKTLGPSLSILERKPVPQSGIDSDDRVTSMRQVQSRYAVHDKAFGRHLRPRYLCILANNSKGYERVDVDEWDRTRSEAVSGGYIFVSYTRYHFPQEDREKELVAIGIASAKQARLQAFWLDFICLPDPPAGEDWQDSHRICDIARGCYQMVIAVKEVPPAPNSNAAQHPASLDGLLQGWASRLWTLPELLLAPTRRDIDVYWVRHNDPNSTSIPVDTIAKRNMAERAYIKDGVLVRQLVDHFEASLQLTQTELFTIGLECLLNRDYNLFFQADPIYALMTLARRRPRPNKDETLFEAFAQLSLLNDSNLLLERLLCTLPKARGSPWSKIEDFWNVKLWDIVPTVQVASITPDDSVLIDGAFGASIEWGKLSNVGVLKRQTIWRTIGNFLVLFAPGWLIVACVLLSVFAETPTYTYDRHGNSHKKVNPAIAAGIIFFLIAFAAIASLPYLVLKKLRGKFWSTQAQLYGLEGHADLEWLETKLFGLCDGRLKWATAGSTQSVHKQKYDGDHIDDEYEALEPVDDQLPIAADLSKDAILDPDRLFTLVDTYSMTAMVFRAVHPPSVALICGHEGGMRRALLCSYDYTTQTFHRETVVRMPTKVLDRMDRIDKFRFSMKNMPL